MGSFNSVCGISKMPIYSDDKVYYGFIIDNKKATGCGGGEYVGTQYSLVTPLMVGTYNDYGWIKEIGDDGQGEDGYKLNKAQSLMLNSLMSGMILKGESCKTTEDFKEAILHSHFDEGTGLYCHFGLNWAEKCAETEGKKLSKKDREKIINANTSRVYLWMARKDVVDKLKDGFTSKPLKDEIKKDVREFFDRTEWNAAQKLRAAGDEEGFRNAFTNAWSARKTAWSGAKQFYGFSEKDFCHRIANLLDNPNKPYMKQMGAVERLIVSTCIAVSASQVSNFVFIPFHAYGGQHFEDKTSLKYHKMLHGLAQKAYDDRKAEGYY